MARRTEDIVPACDAVAVEKDAAAAADVVPDDADNDVLEPATATGRNADNENNQSVSMGHAGHGTQSSGFSLSNVDEAPPPISDDDGQYSTQNSNDADFVPVHDLSYKRKATRELPQPRTVKKGRMRAACQGPGKSMLSQATKG